MGAALESCKAPNCRLDVCGVPDHVTLAESYEVPHECPLRRQPNSLPQALHTLRIARRVVLTRAAAARIGEISGAGGTDVRLAELVVGGRLALVLVPALKPLFGASNLLKKPPDKPKPGPPSGVKTWFGLKVVKDETDEPVPGVTFRVRLPDRSEISMITRADGSAEVHDIDPGACDILEMIDKDGWEVLSID